jgi:hypothetical protein
MSSRADRRRAQRSASKGQKRLDRGDLPKANPGDLDPRFLAGTAMIGRLGAQDFALRWLDAEEGNPHVWVAQCTFPPGRPAMLNGVLGETTRPYVEVAASIGDPTIAVLRLCAQLVDGGTCTHCARPTVFVETHDDYDITAGGMAPGAEGAFCLYQWDPELDTFRRSCEGDE